MARTREEWVALVEDYDATELEPHAWARIHKVPLKVIRRWRLQLIAERLAEPAGEAKGEDQAPPSPPTPPATESASTTASSTAKKPSPASEEEPPAPEPTPTATAAKPPSKSKPARRASKVKRKRSKAKRSRSTEARDWPAIIEAYERSDMSAKQFCLGRGIPQSTFSYQRKKVERARQGEAKAKRGVRKTAPPPPAPPAPAPPAPEPSVQGNADGPAPARSSPTEDIQVFLDVDVSKALAAMDQVTDALDDLATQEQEVTDALAPRPPAVDAGGPTSDTDTDTDADTDAGGSPATLEDVVEAAMRNADVITVFFDEAPEDPPDDPSTVVIDLEPYRAAIVVDADTDLGLLRQVLEALA